MKKVFIGKVEGKKFKFSPTNQAILHDFMAKLDGRQVRVVVERYSGNVSAEQRGYYYGALLPEFTKYQNEGLPEGKKLSEDDCHELLTTEFNGKWIETRSGKKIKISQSTDDEHMLHENYSEFIEKIVNYFGMVGLSIPDPELYKKDRDSAKMINEPEDKEIEYPENNLGEEVTF